MRDTLTQVAGRAAYLRWIVALVLAILSLLVGCSGSGARSNSQQPTDSLPSAVQEMMGYSSETAELLLVGRNHAAWLVDTQHGEVCLVTAVRLGTNAETTPMLDLGVERLLVGRTCSTETDLDAVGLWSIVSAPSTPVHVAVFALPSSFVASDWEPSESPLARGERAFSLDLLDRPAGVLEVMAECECGTVDFRLDLDRSEFEP